MVAETQPENSPQHLLQKWIGELPYQLLLLEKVLLPEDFPFDYSPKSLDALEARLLEHYDSVQGPEKRTEFAESAMAYLGEVLLGIAGGAWGWNTRPVDDLPGQPVVWPDPELELSPVAPMLLISYALRVRTGTAFAKEIERLRQAVTARQHAVPGWEPVKEHTPHVDPRAPLPEDPALTTWLAERREALSAWAENAFDGAWRWNFHPDTLDWLGAVVRQRFATVEEFDASRDEPSEVLEFARNGVLVTPRTEHESDDYFDHLAIVEFIGHVDPDPGEDTRRFYLVQFVRLRDTNYESYVVFATPEQASVLEKELGLELR
jgi:hypothetical protein